MSDFNSSLPIRTEAAGDVVVKLGDGATPSQQASVDASGRLLARITDSSGNSLTSTSNALDVNVANTIAVTQSGTWTVQPGNTANTTPWLVTDSSDGPVSPGTAASLSSLAGLVYNSSAPTLTNGQQAAIQGDASGNLLVAVNAALPTGSNVIGAVTQSGSWSVNQGTAAAVSGAWPTLITDGTNTAAVKAASTAAGASDPSLVVALSPNSPVPAGTNIIGKVNLSIGGSDNGPANPIYVSSVDSGGTIVTDYNTSASVAASSSVNIDYTVTTSTTFTGKQVWVSGSGKIKVEVKYETAASAGTYNTLWVGFNSTSNPNILIPLMGQTQVADAIVRITITNNDKQAQDVYATLSGMEA